jgi:hypothetical protein
LNGGRATAKRSPLGLRASRIRETADP